MTPEQMAARNDSLVKDRTMHVNEVLAKIAGKEQMPAEQVGDGENDQRNASEEHQEPEES